MKNFQIVCVLLDLAMGQCKILRRSFGKRKRKKKLCTKYLYADITFLDHGWLRQARNGWVFSREIITILTTNSTTAACVKQRKLQDLVDKLHGTNERQ